MEEERELNSKRCMRITPGVRDRSFVNDYEINDADFNLPIQVKTKY